MIAFQLQLQALVRCLSSQKIGYAVLGGIAVSIYGEPRLTADIDVNIILDRAGIGAFIRNAAAYGIYPALSDTKKIARDTGVIPMVFKKAGVNGKFDIILAENPLEYSAISRAGLKKVGKVKVRVVTAEDLIIHKITSTRPRDTEDLRGIIIRQKGRLDLKYILTWLRKIDQANQGSGLVRLFNRLLK